MKCDKRGLEIVQGTKLKISFLAKCNGKSLTTVSASKHSFENNKIKQNDNYYFFSKANQTCFCLERDPIDKKIKSEFQIRNQNFIHVHYCLN